MYLTAFYSLCSAIMALRACFVRGLGCSRPGIPTASWRFAPTLCALHCRGHREHQGDAVGLRRSVDLDISCKLWGLGPGHR
ncbi:hypothetical protein GALMADRAFT_748239 [Galerina marginata CBS 339.88]|uniref:Secreted protein n=1 Tax=Galerina marginata (strain CBS 339.88) TaxID=685588 RepID=A0A067SZH7_GALM3|nr:hypothetical protein GALMADRAFT_748239 [Galerina marginata CBS 339.88]